MTTIIVPLSKCSRLKTQTDWVKQINVLCQLATFQYVCAGHNQHSHAAALMMQ